MKKTYTETTNEIIALLAELQEAPCPFCMECAQIRADLALERDTLQGEIGVQIAERDDFFRKCIDKNGEIIELKARLAACEADYMVQRDIVDAIREKVGDPL